AGHRCNRPIGFQIHRERGKKGVGKVGMVEEVESIKAQLHCHMLTQPCVLGQAKVEVMEVGSQESIAWQVSKMSRASNAASSHRIPGTWRGESAEIQKLAGLAGSSERIANHIRPLHKLVAVVVIGK